MKESNQPIRQGLDQRATSDTGPKLSSLGWGCWQLGGGDCWGPSNQAQATRLIQQALDWGINYFDTAEMYNEGRSEVFLGQALKEIVTDDVIVGTKVWPTHLHPQTLRRSCEDSLKRLGRDTIENTQRDRT
jgi:aryl-alcohol dehydrogenase-like predicted oxidoreductase